MQGVPLVGPLRSPTGRLLLLRSRGRCCRCLLRMRLLLLFVQLLDRLYLLLQLHPPILEPDLDLPFRQAERVCHLDPPPPGEVVARVEFLLQLERLVARVGLSAAPAHSVRSCNQQNHSETFKRARRRKDRVSFRGLHFVGCQRGTRVFRRK